VIDRRTGNRTAANADRLLAAGPMAAHGTSATWRGTATKAAFDPKAAIGAVCWNWAVRLVERETGRTPMRR
jgi:hypothetical protein